MARKQSEYLAGLLGSAFEAVLEDALSSASASAGPRANAG